jgi:hypothetical protein
MANEKNLKKFKKGQTGNPLGAKLHNKDLKAMRQLTYAEIAEVGSLILQGNLERLKEIRNNPESSVFKVWVCSIAINAINKGDATSLNVILDRIVGKPKGDTPQITINNSAPSMTKQEIAEEVRLAREEIDAK